MLDTYLMITVIFLTLCFDFINGFHDTANAIATCVATRAIRPGLAVAGTCLLNFIGAIAFTGVAQTIGNSIVISAAVINEVIIISGLLGAILWDLAMWYLNTPSSSSYALIGSLIGAVFISIGIPVLNISGILLIIISLMVSPLIAIVISYISMNYIIYLCRNYKPSRINKLANRLQIISAALMAFAHGSNDAQKSMGIITLALVSNNIIKTLEVPIIVKIVCAAVLALGTGIGGWKIMHLVGNKIFKMHPIHGFSADLNSAVVILGATLLSLPVSTTHVVSGAIIGIGMSERIKAIHWNVAKNILTDTMITLPCTCMLGAVFYVLISYIFTTILPFYILVKG